MHLQQIAVNRRNIETSKAEELFFFFPPEKQPIIRVIHIKRCSCQRLAAVILGERNFIRWVYAHQIPQSHPLKLLPSSPDNLRSFFTGADQSRTRFRITHELCTRVPRKVDGRPRILLHPASFSITLHVTAREK